MLQLVAIQILHYSNVLLYKFTQQLLQCVEFLNFYILGIQPSKLLSSFTIIYHKPYYFFIYFFISDLYTNCS